MPRPLPSSCRLAQTSSRTRGDRPPGWSCLSESWRTWVGLTGWGRGMLRTLVSPTALAPLAVSPPPSAGGTVLPPGDLAF